MRSALSFLRAAVRADELLKIFRGAAEVEVRLAAGAPDDALDGHGIHVRNCLSHAAKSGWGSSRVASAIASMSSPRPRASFPAPRMTRMPRMPQAAHAPRAAAITSA